MEWLGLGSIDTGKELIHLCFATEEMSGLFNPGISGLHQDDYLNYSFTAEQILIDISQNNKVIAKQGPVTVTITGKPPRKYSGVPKTLTW